MKFLKDEVHYQRVEQQLTCKILQQRIERFQEKLNQEICSNFPKAFWGEKLTLLNSLMLKILMKETSLLKPDLSKWIKKSWNFVKMKLMICLRKR